MKLSHFPRELFGFALYTEASERSSIDELNSQVVKYTKLTETSLQTAFYIPFGDLDIMMSVSGEFPAKQFIPLLKNVKNSNSLRIFPLEAPEPTFADETPLEALVLLKLDELEMTRDGCGRLDWLVAHGLNALCGKCSEHIRVEPYATLGWFDLVLLLRFSYLSDLARFVTRLRFLETSLSVSELSEAPMVKSTVSIPMVRVEANGDQLCPASEFPEQNVSASVRVACSPCSRVTALVAGFEKGLNCRGLALFGPEDFVFRVHNISLASLFRRLLELREEYGNDLLFTRTSLVLSETQ